MDKWVKHELSSNSYTLEKYESFLDGKIKFLTHLKLFIDGKLSKFDINIPEEKKILEKFKEPINPISHIFFFLDNPEHQGEFLEQQRFSSMEEYLNHLVGLFWKVYNSYDNWKDVGSNLFNDFAYISYYSNNYIQGIYFASKALEIEKISSYYDTIGEGYENLSMLDLAFENYQQAYKLDLEGNKFIFSHVCNYTKSAIKIDNRDAAKEGINTLIEKFPDDDYNDILIDYLASYMESFDFNPKMYKRDISGLKSYFKDFPSLERLFNQLTYSIRNGYDVRKYLNDAGLLSDKEFRFALAKGFFDISGFLSDILEKTENSEMKKDYNACIEAVKILEEEKDQN